MSKILVTPSPETPEAQGQKIFFCESPGYAAYGLYNQENLNDGSLKTPARALQFTNCLFATTDPAEIKFLQSKAPKVVECKDMDEWHLLYNGGKLKRAALYNSADETNIEVRTSVVDNKGSISQETEKVDNKTVVK